MTIIELITPIVLKQAHKDVRSMKELGAQIWFVNNEKDFRDRGSWFIVEWKCFC